MLPPVLQAIGSMTVFKDGEENHLLFGKSHGYVDRNMTTQVEPNMRDAENNSITKQIIKN